MRTILPSILILGCFFLYFPLSRASISGQEILKNWQNIVDEWYSNAKGNIYLYFFSTELRDNVLSASAASPNQRCFDEKADYFSNLNNEIYQVRNTIHEKDSQAGNDWNKVGEVAKFAEKKFWEYKDRIVPCLDNWGEFGIRNNGQSHPLYAEHPNNEESIHPLYALEDENTDYPMPPPPYPPSEDPNSDDEEQIGRAHV